MRTLLKQVAEPLDQSSRHIPLTQGQFAIVDASDFEWLSRWKWCLLKLRDDLMYAQTWVYDGRCGRPFYLMHRLILGAKKGQFCDHKNWNGIDNRRSNLRLCTRSQNQANRPLQSNNIYGYRGIYFDPERVKWEAKIKVQSKTVHLGRYETKEQAARAYNDAATFYFGEFAQLNLI